MTGLLVMTDSYRLIEMLLIFLVDLCPNAFVELVFWIFIGLCTGLLSRLKCTVGEN
jgi:hypothetical protein